MAVRKRRNSSGKTVWQYVFDAPGSTRVNRRQIKESGFTTKHDAEDAEANRRADEIQKHELAKTGRKDPTLPKTLAMLSMSF